MKTLNGISVTLRTTVGPQCDVIHSNFAFGVGVDLHLHRVHFLVYFSVTVGVRAFPFSALTLLVERQEGHPVRKKNWVLVCWL